jgi:hypothetical protein
LSSRTVTPDSQGTLHGSPETPARRRPTPPARAELAGAALLHAGSAQKADLWLVDRDGEPVVVKDFARKRPWVRAIGRLQVARECRAYDALDGVPGLPRFHGRVDALALAIERVTGHPLASKWHWYDGRELMRQLTDTVARMHAAGVVHLDLRSRDNILVDPTGRVWVLDLASAVCLRPGGFAHRLFFRWLRLTDESALLKWKQLVDRDGLTDAEAEFLDRHRFWRALWPVKRGPRPASERRR